MSTYLYEVKVLVYLAEPLRFLDDPDGVIREHVAEAARLGAVSAQDASPVDIID
jgi:hypothetical protein